METNKAKKSRRNKAGSSDSDKPKQSVAKLTGNEKYDKDIFIEMEPSSKTSLVVSEPISTSSQNTNDDQQVQAIPPAPRTSSPLNQGNLEVQSKVSSQSDVDESTQLPGTVTKLRTPNGSEVFLIGTAHFSPTSVQDVKTVIRTIRPSAVILELCNERAFMLSLDEAALLEQNRKLSFDKIRSAIAEKGVAQGLIFIALIKMSVSLTEKLGLAPGAEFRAGSNEAMKIPGCSVVLGDRSLRLTVARAVASISLWQKIKLIYQVVVNEVSITQEEVEKCKDKDILEQMLHELGGEFPGFKRVLLDERNLYLAHSIYGWAQRSETSMGPQRVVGIVGIGHVAGIVNNWGKTTNEDIKLVCELPQTSKTRRIVTKTIKYCSVAMLFYVCYRTCVPSNVQTAIHDKIIGR